MTWHHILQASNLQCHLPWEPQISQNPNIMKQEWAKKSIMFNKIFILTVPNEVKLMKKEYFNRWYGLNSFYMAMTLSKIPVQVSKLLLTAAKNFKHSTSENSSHISHRRSHCFTKLNQMWLNTDLGRRHCGVLCIGCSRSVYLTTRQHIPGHYDLNDHSSKTFKSHQNYLFQNTI